MRHVFILNPCAGKKQAALALREKIKAYFSTRPQEDYAMYLTDSVGAATRIAARESAQEMPVRLYACGGDGTLQEVANGILPNSQTELTVVPCGSGNDYIRTFGSREMFLDIPQLIEGVAVPVDAVDCGGRLSLNIASIGMDAKVAAKMHKFKSWPLVSGSLAYDLAIVDVILHRIGDYMKISIDTPEGTVTREGQYLIALAANGQYYGGGYRGAPQAIEDDGILDFVLIKKIGRLQLLSFLKKYKAGDYADLDCCEHIRGTAMQVHSKRNAYCNVDGECTYANTMSFAIRPHAFRFVVPQAVAQAKEQARKTVGGAQACVCL